MLIIKHNVTDTCTLGVVLEMYDDRVNTCKWLELDVVLIREVWPWLVTF
jgi:hypothetical protein